MWPPCRHVHRSEPMKRILTGVVLIICAVCCLYVVGCAAPPPPEPGEPAPEEPAVDLEGVHKRLEELSEQRRRSSEANYQRALALHEEGKEIEALSYARQAVEHDPSNAEAAALLSEIRKALGRTGTDMASQFGRIEVKRQLIQHELTERFAGGEKNLRAGRYAEAVQDFKEVLRIIRIGRPILDTGEMETRARRLLTEAEDKRRVQAIEERKKEEREARGALEREIEKKRGEKEQRLRELWLDYEFHRNRHDYDRARQTLEAIVAEDAERKEAYLRNIEELDAERMQWKRRQWVDDLKYNTEMQMNQVEEALIPFEEVFNYGDREHWRKRILERAKEMREMYAETTVRSNEDIRVLGLVRDATVTDFKTSEMITRVGREKPYLSDIKNYLGKILPIPFSIDANLEDKEEAEREVDLDLPGKLKLTSVLNLICLKLDISWHVKRGTVVFAAKEEAANLVVRRYDVSDIIFPLKDFPGEMVKLSEDEEGGVALGGTEDEEEDVNRINRFNMKQLKDLIRLNTGGGEKDWSDRPEDVNMGYMQEYNGELLYIRQREKVHEEINVLLERVRRLGSLLVNIETRFITVEKNFLRRVGVDFRDLGPIDPQQLLRQADGGTGRDIRIDIPGLIRYRGSGGPFTSGIFYSDSNNDIGVRTDNIISSSLLQTNLTGAGGTSVQLQILDKISFEAILRAVRQDSRRQLLTSPRITCFNAQQASIYVGTQQTYIKSYRTGAGSVNLPELDLIASSTVLDVRPVVSADRRYITLFLRPVITFEPDLTKKARFRRGTDAAGNPIMLEITLPSLDSQDLRTVVIVPDGGTVLIGGLKEAEDKYRKGEIPILAKIPLLGFFFRSELDSRARRQLIVLVTAKIIAPDEEETKL